MQPPNVIVALILCLGSACAQSALWSLEPVRKPKPPQVRDTAWPRNPIDHFVLARLEQQGVKPSSEAAPHTLARRLTLDLTGLPPSSAQLAQPVDALVAELLRSPHHGEKWARFWLDQARYADSDGFRSDRYRPHAWRWRNWVIDALNADMPFDQFTIEQIAGDLLPNASVSQRAATGFQRNTLTNREGGIDPEQFRVEQVVDRTNTLGTVWLGLTVGCAQCHDHKYDPITQRDYYRLFAFFNSADELNIDAPLPGELGPYLQARPAFDRRRRELLEGAKVPALQAGWEKRMIEAAGQPGRWLDWDHAFDDLRTDCEDGEKILRTSAAKRTPRQQKILTDYFIRNYHRVITKEEKARLGFDQLSKQLRELDATLPVLSEAPTLAVETPRKTHVLARGDFRSPGVEVTPGTPAALHRLAPTGDPTRLDLARWLVSPENPLTARVIVNRIWQEYFGRGLVRTSENFGSQGERPSHPELLDWLAAEFIDSGWSLKHIHRLIVTSATYRQASKFRPELAAKDPDNVLLARQARFRLPAELIRDSALFASGLLDTAIGGPSVKDGYRRGLYLQVRRTAPDPMMSTFDAPNGYAPVCRRGRSVNPLQALSLLNDPIYYEAAQTLAVRLTGSTSARLNQIFQLTLGRKPTEREVETLTSFHQTQQDWAALCSIILNLDEFLTRE